MPNSDGGVGDKAKISTSLHLKSSCYMVIASPQQKIAVVWDSAAMQEGVLQVCPISNDLDLKRSKTKLKNAFCDVCSDRFDSSFYITVL